MDVRQLATRAAIGRRVQRRAGSAGIDQPGPHERMRGEQAVQRGAMPTQARDQHRAETPLRRPGGQPARQRRERYRQQSFRPPLYTAVPGGNSEGSADHRVVQERMRGVDAERGAERVVVAALGGRDAQRRHVVPCTWEFPGWSCVSCLAQPGSDHRPASGGQPGRRRAEWHPRPPGRGRRRPARKHQVGSGVKSFRVGKGGLCAGVPPVRADGGIAAPGRRRDASAGGAALATGDEVRPHRAGGIQNDVSTVPGQMETPPGHRCQVRGVQRGGGRSQHRRLRRPR